MIEILLQTIVEKLEAMEIALLKDSKAGNDEIMLQQMQQQFKTFQNGTEKIVSQLNANNVTLHSFSKEINALRFNLGNDVPKEVKHIHHFHKLVWVTVSLFILSILLAYGWFNCYKEKKVLEASDFKYRYWKVEGNASLLKLTCYTDSLYNMDREGFIEKVIRAEQHHSQPGK